MAGYYTPGYIKMSFEDTQKLCALRFFYRDHDGSVVEYLLDMERFLQSKEIGYVVGATGSCEYDEQNNSERCNYVFNRKGESNPTQLTEFIHYYRITPVGADGIAFSDEKTFEQFMQSPKEWKDPEFTYRNDASSIVTHRCVDVNDESISQYVNGSSNAFTQKQYDEITSVIYGKGSGALEIADRVVDEMKANP